jgi:hypothetical protein
MCSKKLYFTLLIFMGLPVFSSAADVYRSSTQHAETVPITYGAVTKDVVLYSVRVPYLAKGTLVDVRGHAMVTTECKYNVGIGRFLVRSRSADSCSENAVRLAPSVMDNFDREGLHHKGFNVIAADVIPYPSYDTYYNLCIRAITTNCQNDGENGRSVKVEPKGVIDAIVHKDAVSTLIEE